MDKIEQLKQDRIDKNDKLKKLCYNKSVGFYADRFIIFTKNSAFLIKSFI